ncbi:MAG: YceI family protein [Phycisphaerales bacterium]
MNPIRAIVATSAVVSIACAVLAQTVQQQAVETEAIQPTPHKPHEPQAPAEVAEKGTLYYTLSGKEAQVLFTSKAPLENIVGKSNKVVGYAVAGPADNPAKLVAAHWVLPVESMATGIPLRDAHMAGKEWLDGESHPTIEFKLASVEGIKEIKRGKGFSTWNATLVGDMTIRGVTRKLRVTDARLSFLDASDRTASIAPGDLLFVKTSYAVKLSDFGMTHKDVPDKVADEIQLEQTLRLSTTRQEVSANAEHNR